jgi:hypothetical protein
MIEERSLSGVLYMTGDSGAISKIEFLKCHRLANDHAIPGTHWGQTEFSSPVALSGEDEYRTEGPFVYPIFYRISGGRLLLLSKRRHIVEELNQRYLSQIFRPPLHPVQIAVDGLVREVTKAVGPYVLSFVHARLAAFGTSLRSLSFYGDDVSDAKMFRENVALFNCHTCGLRSVVGGPEIIRLGNDGGVSFVGTRANRLIEVEQALGFVGRQWFLNRQGRPDPQEFVDS